MTKDSIVRLHLPAILLVLAFLIALAFYLALPPERVPRTLFFPGTTGTELSSERRLVPRLPNGEREVHLLVEELLLGPANIAHRRILPRETSIRTLLLREEVVYLDLTAGPIIERSDADAMVETALEAIERSILFNFRSVDEVVITFGGNVPFAPAHRPVGR